MADHHQPQFAKLLLGNRARGPGEGVLALLVLGEGDDLPDGGATRHHGQEAVQAPGDAPVGRGPVGEGLQEEAELLLLLLLADPQKGEDPGLEQGVVDADGPPAHLHPIEHQVVGQARTLPGSLSRRGRSSGWGLVKGWCM